MTVCSHTLYESFNDICPEEWGSIAAGDVDLPMDLRLLQSFQRTMAGQCKCWGVILRDERHKPVAAACLCLFRVDGAESTGGVTRAITDAVRAVWPGFGRFGVLFCGLPVPSGASHLRIAPGVDSMPVLVALERAMRALARRESARLLVFKELDDAECERLKLLKSAGYLRGEIPALHILPGQFGSFDEYSGAMRSRYRRKMTHSLKKLEKAGFNVECVRGAQIGPQYGADVYALYDAVWQRSEYRLEHLPAEFFRDLGQRFGDDALMTLISRGGRVAAFTIALASKSVYHNLYGGIDYTLNEEGDLFFNLFYHDLDHAFRSGAPEIHLGQTSDHFKGRLGTTRRRLFFYVRAVNPIVQAGLRAFSRWAFPRMADVESHDVFRSPSAAPVE